MTDLTTKPTNSCQSCGHTLNQQSGGQLCFSCLLADPVAASSDLAPPPAEEIADLIPGIRILELLGVGGMGAVYRARQIALNRDVAVKLLTFHGFDSNFRRRFLREAQAMASLAHPNIVGVIEFSEIDEIGCIVMELVEGSNLEDVMVQSPRPSTGDVLDIVSQICRALDYAHGQKVVHRDLKPANILVENCGEVKIADFGIAKMLSKTTAEGEPPLTASGRRLGTARYMAPEQYQSGASADPRSDIFSLGVIFYELLTGDVPIGQFKPPSAKVATSAWIDKIVLRAMDVDPEKRFATGAEFLAAIDEGRKLNEVQASGSNGLAMNLLWLAAAATILLGGGIYFFLNHADRPQSNDQQAPPSQTGLESRENSLGIRLLKVPGEGHFMASTEVRVRDFQIYHDDSLRDSNQKILTMAKAVSGDIWQDKGQTWVDPGFPQSADHPVLGVSYAEATLFCEWLTSREVQDLEPGWAYRLPTASDWRAGAALEGRPSLANSSTLGNLAGAELSGDTDWPKRFNLLTNHNDGFRRTSPVATVAANKFGFYDLIGNAAEWCIQSWLPDAPHQAIIGGSWASRDLNSLVSEQQLPIDTCRADIGFRVVLAFDPSRLVIPPEPVPPLPPATQFRMVDNTITIELIEFAGYSALILANRGLAPSEESFFFKNYGFKVHLVYNEEEGFERLHNGEVAAIAYTPARIASYGDELVANVPLVFTSGPIEDGFIVTNQVDGYEDLIGGTFALTQHTYCDAYLRELAVTLGFAIHPRSSWQDPARPDAINLLYFAETPEATAAFQDDIIRGRNRLRGCFGWDPMTTEVLQNTNGRTKIYSPVEGSRNITDILVFNRAFCENHQQELLGIVHGIIDSAETLEKIKKGIIPGDDELALIASELSPEEPWTVEKLREEINMLDFFDLDDNLEYLAMPQTKKNSLDQEVRTAARALGVEQHADSAIRFSDLSALKALRKKLGR